jgi:hypothetical protein
MWTGPPNISSSPRNSDGSTLPPASFPTTPMFPAPVDPESGYKPTCLPTIFTDPGWALLGTSILSTSNCGNPALRLFGFGPVVADGYGIGYIIKEDGISLCVFSTIFFEGGLWLTSSDFVAVLRQNIFKHGDSLTRCRLTFLMCRSS